MQFAIKCTTYILNLDHASVHVLHDYYSKVG